MTNDNQIHEAEQHQAPQKGYTPPVGKHKFLLFMVISMGVLLLVGFAGLIYMVVNQVNEDAATIRAETPSTNQTVPTNMTKVVDNSNFGSMDIQKPENSKLVDYTSDGTYLTLRFKSPNGAEELIIIHLTSGKEKGRLKLADK
jgi:hypothetical protein